MPFGSGLSIEHWLGCQSCDVRRSGSQVSENWAGMVDGEEEFNQSAATPFQFQFPVCTVSDKWKEEGHNSVLRKTMRAQ